jgi:hypothetical protein
VYTTRDEPEDHAAGVPRTGPSFVVGHDGRMTALGWSDHIDAILGGDLTAALAYVTPAGGVVLSAVAPIGLHDRDAGTVGFTTSLGFGRKLDRIALDPKVALAYHTRQFGFATEPGFVLVQGTAVVQPDSQALRDELEPRAERFLGPIKRGRFWDRWLAAYYQDRVLVTVDVDRIVSWADDAAHGEPDVLGPALVEPEAQAPPKKGTAARVDVGKVTKKLGAAHRLVGWRDGDGHPFVVPVGAMTTARDHLALHVGGGRTPSGGRRAAVLAHDYRPQLVGLRSGYALGWLDVDGAAVRFYPHTTGGFSAPPNKTILLLANGFLARRGLNEARKSGRTTATAPAPPAS